MRSFGAFRSAFVAIKIHYGVFSLLILLELLFFCTAGVLLYHYTAGFGSAMEEFSSLIDGQPWLKEPLTQENLAQLNIPATDTATLDSHYRAMIDLTFALFFHLAITFALFRGASVTLTYYLIFGKKRKELFAYFGKYLVVSSLFLCVLFFLLSITVESFANGFAIGAFSPSSVALPLIGSILLLYLFPVSVGLLGLVRLRNLPLETIRYGFKRFPLIMLHYALVLFLIAIPLALLIFFLEQLGILAILLVILFFAFVVYGRAIIIAFFQEHMGTELKKEIHKEKKTN